MSQLPSSFDRAVLTLHEQAQMRRLNAEDVLHAALSVGVRPSLLLENLQGGVIEDFPGCRTQLNRQRD